ncbi:hypothetical protein OG604_50580 [Streptomyces sp. NBC_01231]|nr:hypothetical protein OG604_00285 [Streptomyces sp. NBC_01231]WSQ15269.1 hypothetical protein OG604_50580 [Streptomyces sp. NBC_01231]
MVAHGEGKNAQDQDRDVLSVISPQAAGRVMIAADQSLCGPMNRLMAASSVIARCNGAGTVRDGGCASGRTGAAQVAEAPAVLLLRRSSCALG